MANGADGDRLQALGMLASALAGRPVAVAPLDPGEPSWTDGQTVFVDPSARSRENLESVAVHASLIAAGSLTPEIVGALVRHPRLAKRYLAVEGHRALVANGDVLPGVLNRWQISKRPAAATHPNRRCRWRRVRARSMIRRRRSVSSVPARSWRPAPGPRNRWTTRRSVTLRGARARRLSRNSMTARSTIPTIPTCSAAPSAAAASSASG